MLCLSHLPPKRLEDAQTTGRGDIPAGSLWKPQNIWRRSSEMAHFQSHGWENENVGARQPFSRKMSAELTGWKGPKPSRDEAAGTVSRRRVNPHPGSFQRMHPADPNGYDGVPAAPASYLVGCATIITPVGDGPALEVEDKMENDVGTCCARQGPASRRDPSHPSPAAAALPTDVPHNRSDGRGFP